MLMLAARYEFETGSQADWPVNRVRAFRFFALIITCLGIVLDGKAAPYVPADGSEVLERVRDRPLDASARELRLMRAELSRDPQSLALATRMARRYIEESRARGDPRYLGYAQAALTPWWTQPQPPNVVLVLRATIRQSHHDFDGALEDLSRVLKTAPANAQAWLTRATILQVRGEYAQPHKAVRPCGN